MLKLDIPRVTKVVMEEVTPPTTACLHRCTAKVGPDPIEDCRFNGRRGESDNQISRGPLKL